jgi:phospholipid/cholesterol/gamma-HCH transport system substrate-binding protein
MNRAYLRVAGVAALALIVLGAVLLVNNPFRRKIVVKAYFGNAMTLRVGAPVRLAGVEIGSVESVRARPELKEAPAEVVMLLTPSYELNIPSDSTASLETAGALGETYVEIDVGHASGPTIGSNAVLRTVATPQITTQEFIERVGDILSHKCDCDSGKANAAEDASTHKNTSKNGSQPR